MHCLVLKHLLRLFFEMLNVEFSYTNLFVGTAHKQHAHFNYNVPIMST